MSIVHTSIYRIEIFGYHTSWLPDQQLPNYSSFQSTKKIFSLPSNSGGASQPLLVGHRLLNWGILTLMRWGTRPTWPHLAPPGPTLAPPLPSNDRVGLTHGHEPLLNIDIMSGSPLHTFTCVSRWFMLVVYHLHSGAYK